MSIFLIIMECIVGENILISYKYIIDWYKYIFSCKEIRKILFFDDLLDKI